MTQATVNDNLILLGGKSAAGKSASLMNLRNPEGVWYFNCESGKKLPFRSKFRQFTITDPYQVYEGFDAAQADDNVHTLVIDSQTYLLDMYESLYVQPAADGRKAWGEFAKYFKDLMQIYVARSSKNVIFTAHTLDQLNESDMIMETKVPVKGALKNNGIESYFSQVIAAKKMTLKALEGYESDLLNITDEERALGFKYVFQTKLTKETVGERVRGPLGLFDHNETFIDNNMQLVLDRLHEYYDN
ncbi:AAA family ATPase [Larsenimonas suaedae]|uniref:AAA family ATPase n=1 Tax=Larsenimonas suaedae TaxID=1851019 RepID=A0ABU1GZB9_9GAMM|nr:AAA family ATPase [Larsenimonas suaedae]MCM2973800.1 ATP-binding protein [Larsenimonas suaedae]MDR5897324.1 AAA family ATPase [Larsenimonas suaedae]